MGRCCIFSSIIPGQFNYFSSRTSCLILGSRSMESFQPVIALRRLYTEHNAIYASKLHTKMHQNTCVEHNAIYISKLHTKMYQNTCVDFKVGYVDAKSDAIAFCVKTYPSGSFIKNRTNIHEMQNRMKIAFCVKPPNLPFFLRIKGASHELFVGASVGLAPALISTILSGQKLFLNERLFSPLYI